MTIATPIQAAEAIPDAYRAALETLVRELSHGPRDVLVAVLVEALECLGADHPEFTGWRESLRADAKFWAGSATPHMLEAYAHEAVAEITRYNLSGPMAKRMVAAGWRSLSPADRAAFLKAVAGGNL